MKKRNSSDIRILSIAPSTRGFGFALVKDSNVLAEWGTKTFGDKDEKIGRLLPKIEKLMVRFQPSLLVMPDTSEKGSRRAPWIRKLVKQAIALAQRHGVEARLIPKEQLRQFFFAGQKGTKHARARILAERFPEELGDLLPPERQAWMNEPRQMQMFDAVALALASSAPWQPESQ
jgi:hypothetical protein